MIKTRYRFLTNLRYIHYKQRVFFENIDVFNINTMFIHEKLKLAIKESSTSLIVKQLRFNPWWI